ncbi:MAG: DUF1559 domain-containing protein [Planctomycetota bacterium]
MKQQLGAFACIGLLAVVCFTTPVSAQAPEVNHVSEDAFAVITAKYNEAIQERSLALVPYELINVAGEKEFGVDMKALERVSMIVEPFDDLIDPPNFAIVFEFDKPQEVGGNTLGMFQREQIDGMRAWTPPVPDGPLFVEADEQTFMIVMPDMLDRTVAGGGLRDLMRKVPPTDQMNAYIEIEPMREMILANLPPRGDVPPMFGRYYNLLDLITSISISQGFEEDAVSRLTIQTASEDDAEKVALLLADGVDLAKQGALSGLAFMMMEAMDAEYQDATIDYSNRLAETLREAIKESQDGDKLVINLEETMAVSGVATAGVAVGMLLPAVQQVREAARRTTAMNNLRQICLALHNYESAYNHFPAQAICDDDGNPLLSWRVAILPYIEQQALYDEFRLDEPWNSEHNIQLLDKIPPVYVSPNVDLGSQTIFLGIEGENMLFNGGRELGFADIRDGTSNTIAFVEADINAAVPWTQPADYAVDPDWAGSNLGNLRPGGFNAAMLDGSVQFIDAWIDDENLMNLFQYDDGNVVDWNWAP